MSDFIGKLLLNPYIHFHLRISGKLKNVNNHIIASVRTPQYEDNEDDIDDTNNSNKSNKLEENRMSSDDINNLLNYGYDEYTNSLLENCLLSFSVFNFLLLNLCVDLKSQFVLFAA